MIITVGYSGRRYCHHVVDIHPKTMDVDPYYFGQILGLTDATLDAAMTESHPAY